MSYFGRFLFANRLVNSCCYGIIKIAIDAKQINIKELL